MRSWLWLQWAAVCFAASFSPDGEKLLGFHPTHKSSNSNPTNYAASLPSEKAKLQVVEVPFPQCGDDELIIQNRAVAVNPIDWKIQSLTVMGFNITYPVILGEDVAGKVFAVGTKLKDRFHVGQRVMAHTSGLNKGSAYGGFQLYPILTGATTSPIPDDLLYSEVAVLPLSISTAAAGLFMKASLGLKYPIVQYDVEAATNKDGPILLLWGGASSVGSTVIQLATAAGYSVITTASPSNYEYCKSLGATHVLDYHNADVIVQLAKVMAGKTIVGAYDAIGSGQTVQQCASVLHALGGGKIASVGWNQNSFDDVTVTSISSGEIVSKEPEVARKIWGTYVPAALRSGKLVASPEALVVGKGLEKVQEGFDRQKEGVSARKVEILLG